MSFKIILRLSIALLITLAAAYYQRKTGPTYPLQGEMRWQDVSIHYTLDRSHGGAGDQVVTITGADTALAAILVYRRFNSADAWTGMLMSRNQIQYTATIPHQPPAGKMEYFILLQKGERTALLPADTSIVTRFKGDVPSMVLVPHILFMFIAMLLSTAAGLEALVNGKLIYRYALWTTACLLLGGMILGPLVQYYAFGELWTGIPFGFDLTDNKTLLTLAVWLLALWKGRGNRPARLWIFTAAVVLLLMYSIPHSVMGSELNYQTMQIETGK
jgi:hypothetical protein